MPSGNPVATEELKEQCYKMREEEGKTFVEIKEWLDKQNKSVCIETIKNWVSFVRIKKGVKSKFASRKKNSLGVRSSDHVRYAEAIKVMEKRTRQFRGVKTGDSIAIIAEVVKESTDGRMYSQEVVKKVTVVGKYPHFLRCMDKDNKVYCVDKMAIVSI